MDITVPHPAQFQRETRVCSAKLPTHSSYLKPAESSYSRFPFRCLKSESSNGDIQVGHEISALTKERTFDALYIQPILKTLQRQNPTTPFADGSKTKK